MMDLREVSEIEAGQVQGGAVAPLMALLLSGTTGYAVDLGYVALTSTKLQNADDAASYVAVSGAGNRR